MCRKEIFFERADGSPLAHAPRLPEWIDPLEITACSRARLRQRNVWSRDHQRAIASNSSIVPGGGAPPQPPDEGRRRSSARNTLRWRVPPGEPRFGAQWPDRTSAKRSYILTTCATTDTRDPPWRKAFSLRRLCFLRSRQRQWRCRLTGFFQLDHSAAVKPWPRLAVSLDGL